MNKRKMDCSKVACSFARTTYEKPQMQVGKALHMIVKKPNYKLFNNFTTPSRCKMRYPRRSLLIPSFNS